MMEEMSENVGINYHEVLDSKCVAQPVNYFLFPLEEEMGSAENRITKDEDECFSETMTSPAPQQPLQPRSALRFIENLKNSQQLFD